MNYKTFALLVLAFASLSNCVIQQKGIIDISGNNKGQFFLTPNKKFIIQQFDDKVQQVHTISDLSTTTSSDNSINWFQMHSTEDKIVEITGSNAISQYTLPDLNVSQLVPAPEVMNSNFFAYKRGTILTHPDGYYVVHGFGYLQKILYDGTSSGVISFYEDQTLCKDIEQSSQVRPAYHPTLAKITVTAKNKICVLDISDLDNLTTEEGSYDGFDKGCSGILQGKLCFHTITDVSGVMSGIQNLVTNKLEFSFKGSYRVRGFVAKTQEYFAQAYENTIVVHKTDDYCKVQKLELEGINSYSYDWVNETLIIKHNEKDELIILEIGDEWETLKTCDQTSANVQEYFVGTSNNEGGGNNSGGGNNNGGEQNSQSNLLIFSLISLFSAVMFVLV